jgi:hypothetical protein
LILFFGKIVFLSIWIYFIFNVVLISRVSLYLSRLTAAISRLMSDGVNEARERERKRERKGERKRGRERKRERELRTILIVGVSRVTLPWFPSINVYSARESLHCNMQH